MSEQPHTQRHHRRPHHHALEHITPYLAMFLTLLYFAAGWLSQEYFWIGLSLVYVAIAKTTQQRQRRSNAVKRKLP